jgi:hypothetical protein
MMLVCEEGNIMVWLSNTMIFHAIKDQSRNNEQRTTNCDSSNHLLDPIASHAIKKVSNNT